MRARLTALAVAAFVLLGAAALPAHPGRPLPPDREPTCPGIPAWSGIVAVELAEEALRFDRHAAHRERGDAGWRVLVLPSRNRVYGPVELDELREELNRDVLVEGRCFVPTGGAERTRIAELLPEGRALAFRVLDPEGRVVEAAFHDPRAAVRRAGALARRNEGR